MKQLKWEKLTRAQADEDFRLHWPPEIVRPFIEHSRFESIYGGMSRDGGTISVAGGTPTAETRKPLRANNTAPQENLEILIKRTNRSFNKIFKKSESPPVELWHDMHRRRQQEQAIRERKGLNMNLMAMQLGFDGIQAGNEATIPHWKFGVPYAPSPADMRGGVKVQGKMGY